MTIKLMNKEMGIFGPLNLPQSLPIIKTQNQNPEKNAKMTND